MIAACTRAPTLATGVPAAMTSSACLPLGSVPRSPAGGASPQPVHRATLAGEAVELLPERALHWIRERTLFVADVHLGKAAAFRAGGVPVPRDRPPATSLA